ncbi:tyrosine-type recombinase/integrase [Microbacterium sp. A84]|uniref:tyrosine-type recombinase/integrase n=1 Tax=Microbacterium sp. A84 TaxID=3450715 RepID=UPI003F41C9ED
MNVKKYETANGQRYRVRFRTPAGKQSQKRGFRTKRDAELWAAKSLVDKSHGRFVDPTAGKTLLNAVLRDFVDRKGDRAETTLSNRESHAVNWVEPYWTAWRVGDVRADDIDAWVEWMRDQDAKPDTVEKAYRVLTGTLQLAVGRGLLSHSPALPLKVARPPAKRRAYLTHEQVRELADAIDPRYRLLILTLAYTGLRFGEAAALRRDSLDSAKRRLHVRESVTEVSGKLVWSLPKSRLERPVPLPRFLGEALDTHVTGMRDGDVVFTAARGGTIHLTTWRRRVFYPALKALNARRTKEGLSTFPAITPHDLRHTAASLAIQAGAHVKSLQRMLGHASAAMTLDVYGDLFDTDLDDVAKRLHEAATGAPLS